jgi:hypothetical protein
MILGMSTETYTLIHVVISLVGIGSGFIVVFGLLAGKRLDGWTALFLASTVLTSVTGFGFPFHHLPSGKVELLPSHKVGIISLVVLAVALLARYGRHLAGAWRWIYVICAAMALLPKCLRPGGAGLPEGSGPESDGSNTDRAAIFGGTIGGVGAFRGPHYFRGQKGPH